VGPFDPFESHEEFHAFIRNGIPLEHPDMRTVEEWSDIAVCHGMEYAIKFTHGNLTKRNILVTDDNTITGVVNWDMAGW